jgi:hypothetical protein
MRLVHELEYKPGPQRYPDCLTAQSLDLITTWCQDHGPLGVLIVPVGGNYARSMPRASGGLVQRRYSRGHGQSVQLIESTGDVGDRNASVLVHDLDDWNLKKEVLELTWHRFFPSVNHGQRDTFQYPVPYSGEFCFLYAERVFDFYKAAKFLAGAMAHLSTDPPVVPDPELAWEQARQAINLLRRSVTSVLDFNHDGDLEACWEAPSLLASFAEMYVQDLLFGRPTRTCSCCGVQFVSSAYQAQYCSLPCRYREQKRRLRQQMKHATALHAEGKTAKQIAATLGQTTEVVGVARKTLRPFRVTQACLAGSYAALPTPFVGLRDAQPRQNAWTILGLAPSRTQVSLL